MYKYIRMFFEFLLPILGRAAAQTIADEVVKFAYGEQPKPGHTRFTQKGTGRVADIPTSEIYDHLTPREAFDQAAEDMSQYHNEGYHDVIMVAFDLRGPNAPAVHEWLHNQMPAGDTEWDLRTGGQVYIDSWWVANDERYDRSDCDSAVFVKKGWQERARRLLKLHNMAH